MSEKRFEVAYENYGTWDKILCKKLSYDEVVDLLNELNDERMMYKTTIDKRIVELEEDVTDYHNALFDLHKKYDKLEKENEQLKERNEKLQWELDKIREDLNYFANLKITAIGGSNCGHDRCYVTSMQKKR